MAVDLQVPIEVAGMIVIAMILTSTGIKIYSMMLKQLSSISRSLEELTNNINEEKRVIEEFISELRELKEEIKEMRKAIDNMSRECTRLYGVINGYTRRLSVEGIE